MGVCVCVREEESERELVCGRFGGRGENRKRILFMENLREGCWTSVKLERERMTWKIGDRWKKLEEVGTLRAHTHTHARTTKFFRVSIPGCFVPPPLKFFKSQLYLTSPNKFSKYQLPLAFFVHLQFFKSCAPLSNFTEIRHPSLKFSMNKILFRFSPLPPNLPHTIILLSLTAACKVCFD